MANRIHRTIPVTRWQGGYPAYGSFETACGRKILGAIKSTDRKHRVTCGVCKTSRAGKG